MEHGLGWLLWMEVSTRRDWRRGAGRGGEGPALKQQERRQGWEGQDLEMEQPRRLGQRSADVAAHMAGGCVLTLHSAGSRLEGRQQLPGLAPGENLDDCSRQRSG